jgi:hypothetical protein
VGDEIYTYPPPAFVGYECSDVNAAGIDGDGAAGDAGGSIFDDPLFCDPSQGVFTLDAASPCLPNHNGCGVLMGARNLGCGPVSVQEKSWGHIKEMYR